MKEEEEPKIAAHTSEAPHPYRMRLPGFVVEEEIGLGDVIKRATYAMGIKACDGCQKRAAALNKWVVFSR